MNTKRLVAYFKFLCEIQNWVDLWIMPDGTTKRGDHFDSFLIGGFTKDGEEIVHTFPRDFLRTHYVRSIQPTLLRAQTRRFLDSSEPHWRECRIQRRGSSLTSRSRLVLSGGRSSIVSSKTMAGRKPSTPSCQTGISSLMARTRQSALSRRCNSRPCPHHPG